MTTYYEKRPTFTAAQFNGTNSVEDIMRLSRNFDNFVLNSGAAFARGRLEIYTEGTGTKYTLAEGEWLVGMPDKTFVVMTEEAFRKRFEPTVVTMSIKATPSSSDNETAKIVKARIAQAVAGPNNRCD